MSTLLIVAPSSISARGAARGSSGSTGRSSQSAPLSRGGAPAARSTTTLAHTVSSSYRPSFSGYTPPLGSQIFNRSFSFTDLFFWSYLLNHDGHQQVVVQQPDGQKVTTPTNAVDVIYYVDMAVVVLLGLGVIGSIVWWVNKKTQSHSLTNHSPYGLN